MKRGGRGGGGRGGGRKRQREGGTVGKVLLISAASTRSADCNGELCVAMQIYRPVCLVALAAEDEYTRLRRGETDREAEAKWK